MTPANLRRAIHMNLPPQVRNSKENKSIYLSSIIERDVDSSTECKHIELLKIYYTVKYGGCTHAHYALFDKDNRQHTTILKACHNCEWVVVRKGREIPDLEALGSWLQSKLSPVRKPLIVMNTHECSKIIEAMKGVEAHQMKKIREKQKAEQ